MLFRHLHSEKLMLLDPRDREKMANFLKKVNEGTQQEPIPNELVPIYEKMLAAKDDEKMLLERFSDIKEGDIVLVNGPNVNNRIDAKQIQITAASTPAPAPAN